MGWKLSSIIINPKTDINYENLLNKLGFTNLKKIEDQPYDNAMYPDDDKVYIGSYKNNLIIAANQLPMDFFTDAISSTEQVLIENFPDSEICSVSLQSIINHFGFAVIKKGKKIRVKAGDADIGTVIDIGQPLEQEIELLSKSKIDNNGQRIYYLEHNPAKPYSENQVGENFVFEIFKRYTGELFDADDEILETIFKGYSFSDTVSSSYKNFSGEWQGQFTYGDGYQKNIRGKLESFVINMNSINGKITGFCTDGNKQGDNPARINGFITDAFIGFIKQYDVRYFFDEKGMTQKDADNPSYTIAYSGLYDHLTDSFKGIWRIENKKNWGEWIMNRKHV